MSFTAINVNKETSYTEFICETIADLNSIPHKETLFGCIAYVLENKKLYIMNDNSEWEMQ